MILKTKFCSLTTPHTKFSLNKNMPCNNHFYCYLKTTCNTLLQTEFIFQLHTERYGEETVMINTLVLRMPRKSIETLKIVFDTTEVYIHNSFCARMKVTIFKSKIYMNTYIVYTLQNIQCTLKLILLL